MIDFKFSIPRKVMADDLNFAQHVAHQNYLLYFQDARIAYLKKFGYSESDFEGYGMIISAADCRYKRELFLDDELIVSCSVTDITPKKFKINYQIERNGEICATGSTTNHCFDYSVKKAVVTPEAFIEVVQEFEGI